MKDNYAFAEIVQKPEKVKEKEVAELFSKISPAAQEKIIDLIKSLLLKK